MRRKRLIIYIPTLIILIALFPIGGFSAWTWEAGLRWLYLFVIAILTSASLAPYSVFLAGKIGAIDYPEARKIHSAPMPRLGGFAVYGAVLIAVLRNYQFSPEAFLFNGITLLSSLGSAAFIS